MRKVTSILIALLILVIGCEKVFEEEIAQAAPNSEGALKSAVSDNTFHYYVEEDSYVLNSIVYEEHKVEIERDALGRMSYIHKGDSSYCNVTYTDSSVVYWSKRKFQPPLTEWYDSSVDRIEVVNNSLWILNAGTWYAGEDTVIFDTSREGAGLVMKFEFNDDGDNNIQYAWQSWSDYLNDIKISKAIITYTDQKTWPFYKYFENTFEAFAVLPVLREHNNYIPSPVYTKYLPKTQIFEDYRNQDTSYYDFNYIWELDDEVAEVSRGTSQHYFMEYHDDDDDDDDDD